MTQNHLPGLEPEPPPLTRNQHHPDGGQLPAWITTQLNDNSIGTGSSIARYHRCHKCTAIVITGLDAHILATTATVDPTPLTPATETAMTLLERETYHAQPTPDGYRLTWRFPAHQPDQPVTGHILPAHQCGRRLPGFITPPTKPGQPDHTIGDPPF